MLGPDDGPWDQIPNERRLRAWPIVNRAAVLDPACWQSNQADGRSIADHFVDAGLSVVPAFPGESWGGTEVRKHGTVELVRRRFDTDKLRFFRGCQYTRRDHRNWRFKENADREPDPNERYVKKNDHACDALRYLLTVLPCYEQPRAAVTADDDA